jgi:hypothetical protein
MDSAMWKVPDFPLKGMKTDEAERYLFRKVSRVVQVHKLQDLDEAFFYFRMNLPCAVKELPGTIVRALKTRRSTKWHMKRLSSFCLLNCMDPELVRTIVELKDVPEEVLQVFDELIDDCDGEEGLECRNVILSYDVRRGHRSNLNNVPIWEVDLLRNKENIHSS